MNAVIFAAVIALLLGLLAFAGPQAINAIFSLCVVAGYIAYATPMIARFAFKNDFRPGPFSLGRLVSDIFCLW
jgi:amino acid transporter